MSNCRMLSGALAEHLGRGQAGVRCVFQSTGELHAE